MWSLFHIIFILSPFILAAVLYYLTKNKSDETKYRVGFWLSIYAIVILAARNIEIFILDGYQISSELIPLQICHFANFVLLYAFWKKEQSAFALAFCLNLPAAILSIVYANSLTNYATILNARGYAYIVGHLLIVALTLWALFANLIKLDKKIFIKTVKIMMVLYGVAIVINNLFKLVNLNANYFYTLTPERGTPLEIFYKLGETYNLGIFEINPTYVILVSLFGIIVVFAFYKLYQLIMKLMASHQTVKNIA